MNTSHEHADDGLTPTAFQSEVLAFRATVTDPALSRDDKRRAFGVIVHHAALIDPRDAGFANVGLALHDACLLWLDLTSMPGH
jgi:hypothetical protein